MEFDTFLDAVDAMSAAGLRAVAASVDNDSVTDEVDWWRATIAIDRAIRHGRCSREAARAATRAAHLVQHVAVREGYTLPDADVTRVARAAAEVARALVAGPATQPIAHMLLEHWAPLGVFA
jgi:hypothetical protein